MTLPMDKSRGSVKLHALENAVGLARLCSKRRERLLHRASGVAGRASRSRATTRRGQGRAIRSRSERTGRTSSFRSPGAKASALNRRSGRSARISSGNSARKPTPFRSWEERRSARRRSALRLDVFPYRVGSARRHGEGEAQGPLRLRLLVVLRPRAEDPLQSGARREQGPFRRPRLHEPGVPRLRARRKSQPRQEKARVLLRELRLHVQDDRVAAMNLHRMGIGHLAEGVPGAVAVEQGSPARGDVNRPAMQRQQAACLKVRRPSAVRTTGQLQAHFL